MEKAYSQSESYELLLVVLWATFCDSREEENHMQYDREFKRLAGRYKQLRLEKGMVQEDVLDHHFSVRHYQQLESGRPHSLTTFFRLSSMFGVDPEVLLKGLFNGRNGHNGHKINKKKPRRKN